MSRLRYQTAVLLLVALGEAAGQVPFGTSPAWVSTDLPNYSTGAGWADINRDGRPDLVIANGNDMARQRVVVYYNNGTGTLPTTPGWQSADIDYHGQLSIGDVNGDGFPDVAVSVYIGPTGFTSRGKVKLYMNNGGTLGTSPAWRSRDSLYTFSCAFGDADGDGDPDLAVAAGEAYGSRAEKNRIYYNRNGVLDSLPGWKNSQAGYSYDVAWADIDNDGDLDLAYACEGGPNRIYRNYGDSIGTVPVWSSTDPSQYANSLFMADINGDGFQDLAVSDNQQLGGGGKFKIYQNVGGTMATTPFWSSAASGYGSGINLVDVDADGDRDLIAGGWWEPCRIYLNQSGGFPGSPQWTSSTGSVVETIVFSDVDGDGLDTLELSFPGDGEKRLFLLARAPLQSLAALRVGGDSLAPGEYWCDLENGWLTCAVAPPSGSVLTATVVVSRDLDFAVSNWDANVGNYLFLNTLPPTAVWDGGGVPAECRLDQNYPNPFNPATSIQFSIPPGVHTRASLQVFDMVGRKVATLVDGVVTPGEHSVTFDASGLPSGVYLYRLAVGNHGTTRRMVLLR